MKNKAFYLQKVKEELTDHRYRHTLGVMETAVKLADQYGADREKAETAAILHDFCKFWSTEKMADIIRDSDEIPMDLLAYDKELWHAPVGAVAVERQLDVKDPEILDAIRYHTSGRPHMTLLEKVVWLADYIEPGRHFPGVNEVRELAQQELNRAILQALDNTILFLIKKQKQVYPLTLAARNHIITEIS